MDDHQHQAKRYGSPWRRSGRRGMGGVVLAVLLLGGCQAPSTSSGDMSRSFKGTVDWLRDSAGRPVAAAPDQPIEGTFPAVPDDKRPVVRSAKQRADLTKELVGDRDAAQHTEAMVEGLDDPTQPLPAGAAKADAPPAAASQPGASGVTLVPPAESRREAAPAVAGVQPLDAFDPSTDAAWFRLPPMTFGEGTAELPPDAAARLQAVVALLRENGGTIRLIGYSGSRRLDVDAKANAEANRLLAKRRADAVAEVLVHQGVPPHKLFAGAAPEEQRAAGEMVEIYIDY